MKSTHINLRCAEEEKARFESAVKQLESRLGTGATLTNVILLMMRALTETVEKGRTPILPLECKTTVDSHPPLQYPPESSTARAAARVAENGERYCVRRNRKNGKTGSA